MNKTNSHSHVITGKSGVSSEKVSIFLNEGRKEGKNQEMEWMKFFTRKIFKRFENLIISKMGL